MTLARGPIGALVALALFCAMAALVWFAAVLPLRDWQMRSFQNRDAAVAGINRLGDSIANLQAERAGLATGGTLDIVWSARQMGEATARIQSELSSMASGNGVSLQSVTPTGQRDLSLAQAVTFRIEVEAGLDQITEFLTTLEYHSPVLVVEQATMRRLNRPVSLVQGAPHRSQPLLFAQIGILAPVNLVEGDRP